MLNADCELVVKLGVVVLPDDERDLDSIAKEIERATGQITRVNDRDRRLIVIGAAKSRVNETRKKVAKLGFMAAVEHIT